MERFSRIQPKIEPSFGPKTKESQPQIPSEQKTEEMAKHAGIVPSSQGKGVQATLPSREISTLERIEDFAVGPTQMAEQAPSSVRDQSKKRVIPSGRDAFFTEISQVYNQSKVLKQDRSKLKGDTEEVVARSNLGTSMRTGASQTAKETVLARLNKIETLWRGCQVNDEMSETGRKMLREALIDFSSSEWVHGVLRHHSEAREKLLLCAQKMFPPPTATELGQWAALRDALGTNDCGVNKYIYDCIANYPDEVQKKVEEIKTRILSARSLFFGHKRIREEVQGYVIKSSGRGREQTIEIRQKIAEGAEKIAQTMVTVGVFNQKVEVEVLLQHKTRGRELRQLEAQIENLKAGDSAQDIEMARVMERELDLLRQKRAEQDQAIQKEIAVDKTLKEKGVRNRAPVLKVVPKGKKKAGATTDAEQISGYIMPLYEGSADKLCKVPPRNEQEQLDRWTVFRDVLVFVKDLHGCDLVHTDLKPGNFLIKRINGRLCAFVSDNGGALHPGEKTSEIRSAMYTVPDWSIRKPVSKDEDEYALGVVCQEFFHGKASCIKRFTDVGTTYIMKDLDMQNPADVLIEGLTKDDLAQRLTLDKAIEIADQQIAQLSSKGKH